MPQACFLPSFLLPTDLANGSVGERSVVLGDQADDEAAHGAAHHAHERVRGAGADRLAVHRVNLEAR